MFNPLKFVQDKLVGSFLSSFLDKLPFIGKFLTWFNAVPGRKRGTAAILLAIAAGLQGFGYAPWAEAAKAFIPFLDMLVPGTNVVGVIMAIWGIVHSLIRQDPATPAVQ